MSFSAHRRHHGAQKAIVELLLSDYSRKGFIDALSIRLPTICVRPGKPNLAASSFFLALSVNRLMVLKQFASQR